MELATPSAVAICTASIINQICFNMKMIKFFLFGFAFVLAMNLQAQDTPTTPAPAKQEQRDMRTQKQRPGNREGKQAGQAAEHRQDMVQKLNLTEEQQTQFRAVNQKYRAQMQANRENNPAKTPANREAMQALKASKDAEMQGILTPEQFEIYQAETAPKQGPRGSHRGGQ